jgi:hypothetical protein
MASASHPASKSEPEAGGGCAEIQARSISVTGAATASSAPGSKRSGISER